MNPETASTRRKEAGSKAEVDQVRHSSRSTFGSPTPKSSAPSVAMLPSCSSKLPGNTGQGEMAISAFRGRCSKAADGRAKGQCSARSRSFWSSAGSSRHARAASISAGFMRCPTTRSMPAKSTWNHLQQLHLISGKNAIASPYEEQSSPYEEQLLHELLLIGTNLVRMSSSRAIFDDSISPYEHTYLDIYQAGASAGCCSPALDSQLLHHGGQIRVTPRHTASRRHRDTKRARTVAGTLSKPIGNPWVKEAPCKPLRGDWRAVMTAAPVTYHRPFNAHLQFRRRPPTKAPGGADSTLPAPIAATHLTRTERVFSRRRISDEIEFLRRN